MLYLWEKLLPRLVELHHIVVFFTLEQTIDFDVCHLVQEVPLVSINHLCVSLMDFTGRVLETWLCGLYEFKVNWPNFIFKPYNSGHKFRKGSKTHICFASIRTVSTFAIFLLFPATLTFCMMYFFFFFLQFSAPPPKIIFCIKNVPKTMFNNYSKAPLCL